MLVLLEMRLEQQIFPSTSMKRSNVRNIRARRRNVRDVCVTLYVHCKHKMSNTSHMVDNNQDTAKAISI
jgi:hypothetical protein